MRTGASAPAIGQVDQAVTISGAPRGAQRIALSRGMGGAPWPGWTGQPGATGDVTALSAQTGPEPSIWNRQVDSWPPPPGATCHAALGTTDAGRWTVLNGTIRTTTRTGPHAWSLTVADLLSPLRTHVSVEPLCYRMPGPTPGSTMLRPGLDADYYAHRAFRAAGINNTPPLEQGIIGVSAPMQASAWPEMGTLTGSGSSTLPSATPLFRSAPWGYALHDATLTYQASADLQLTATKVGVMVGPDHNASVALQLLNGPGDVMGQITVHTSKAVSVVWGVGEDRVTLSMPPRTYTRLTVSASNATGRVTISTDGPGTDVSAPYTGARTFRFLRVAADPWSQIAGVVAASHLGEYLTYEPRLRMHTPVVLRGTLRAMSTIHSRPALELINEIAQATCRSWWVDEDGVHQWQPQCVPVLRTTAVDVTSDAHALDGWGESDSLDDRHRRVVVTTEWPQVKAGAWPDQQVWRGSGVTLRERGVPDEDIITVPADETWIGVDLPVHLMGLNPPPGAEWRDYANGRGSQTGAVLVGPGDRTRWPFPPVTETSLVSAGITKITEDEWLSRIEFLATGSVPAGYYLAARTPGAEDGGSLPRWARDRELPVLRANIRARWVPRDARAGSGHVLAGDYEHQGGRWVQGYNGENAQVYADFLASLWVEPLGRVDLGVLHDPRLQVGDVINYVDKHRHGITLRCLAVGIDQESWDIPGTNGNAGQAGQDMTLALVVLAVVKVTPTYDDARRASPGTYTDDQSRNAGRTYTEVTAALTGGS